MLFVKAARVFSNVLTGSAIALIAEALLVGVASASAIPAAPIPAGCLSASCAACVVKPNGSCLNAVNTASCASGAFCPGCNCSVAVGKACGCR